MNLSEFTSLSIAITVVLSFAWNVYQAGKSHDSRLDNYDENVQKELKLLSYKLGELTAKIEGNQGKISLILEHLFLNKSLENLEE